MPNNNNNQEVKIYTPSYLKSLSTVFSVDKAFGDLFQELQTTDGIRHNETAFTVKTCATPVTVGQYDKGKNTAFGTGTGNSSRFGKRTEVVYSDTDVPYDYDLVIHEGIDAATVNNGLDDAVSDRLILHAEAQTIAMNSRNGKFLSDNAKKTIQLVDYTDEKVIALFDELSKDFVNKHIKVARTAYVVADLYNALVNSKNTITGKGSTINIDEANSIIRYKGFTIKQEAEECFQAGDIAYVGANQIAVPFVGAEIARTIPSEDFAGVALQAFAKGGNFILDDNKVALEKVKLKVA